MRLLPLGLFLLSCASAQVYTISTVAGIGRLSFGGAGSAATSAELIQPTGVAADSAGNIFVSDQYYGQVFKISAAGTITVYAGNGQQGFSGDGGQATAAQLNAPAALAMDASGNLFIADRGNGRVRKVTPTGVISSLAAVGGAGVAVDSAGNVYVSQSSTHEVHVIRPEESSAQLQALASSEPLGRTTRLLSRRSEAPTGSPLIRQGISM